MTYDLVVIGTGPGGYVCAIRASQLGLKVAVVEKRKTHGGTCLNIGCIPSKALLHASDVFEEAGHGMETLGVVVGKPKLDLPKMMAHKNATVKSNVDGVAFLLKKNKIDAVNGHGTLLPKKGDLHQVEVRADDGAKQVIETKSVALATGSDVASLPGIVIDETVIVSSTGALDLAAVPKRIVVIGGGVIGLELGSVWRRLGAEVIVVEFMDKILGSMDGEVSKQFQRIQEKQGIKFHLSSKVTKVEKTGKGAKITFEPVTGGAPTELDADIVLVATGRRPYTDGLGLETLGIATEKGRVIIDEHFATNVPGIYAIGDVVRGAMLAHKAEDEGVALAEILVGQKPHIRYECIPGVVYTQPEVASVGATEEELKAKGIAYKVGKFPFMANGRARANNTIDGFAKILADATTDRVLGAHIMGAGAGDMIHEVAVLMEFGGSSEDLARTSHAHPTMSEAVKEAALAADKRALHI
jgi:dihydrolipoamide dehydrogenase